VPGFLSSRPNWVPPPPHPQGSYDSPLWVQGGRHTRLWGMGWRGPNSDEGTDNRHSATLLYVCYSIIPLRVNHTVIEGTRNVILSNALHLQFCTVHNTVHVYGHMSYHRKTTSVLAYTNIPVVKCHDQRTFDVHLC
jgi:hypothetical protein